MDGIPVDVWKCLGEEGTDMLWNLMQRICEQVHEKYVMIVQDMYEGVRTRVKTSVGLTDKIPVSVRLHR